MRFEDRVRTAEVWLLRSGGFLDRHWPPSRLDTNEKRRGEIDAMAVAIARKMPTGLDPVGYQERLDELEDQLSLISSGNYWPSISTLVKAIGAVTGPNSEHPVSGPPMNNGALDSFAIEAARMNAGEGVGEGYLYGVNAKELLDRQLVTEATLENYRKGWFEMMRGTYGEAYARRRQDEKMGRNSDTECPPGAAQPVEKDTHEESEPPPRPVHWSETAEAEDPRWEQLRRARVQAGVIAAPPKDEMHSPCHGAA